MSEDQAFNRFVGGFGLFILLILLLFVGSAVIANHQEFNAMKACVENGGEWIKQNCVRR